ncbi:hypothetical protein J6590_006516, partial [Homalodisca vitripennis]
MYNQIKLMIVEPATLVAGDEAIYVQAQFPPQPPRLHNILNQREELVMYIEGTLPLFCSLLCLGGLATSNFYIPMGQYSKRATRE